MNLRSSILRVVMWLYFIACLYGIILFAGDAPVMSGAFSISAMLLFYLISMD